jgi:DNA replication ATP-dependent helicase Dna2
LACKEGWILCKNEDTLTQDIIELKSGSHPLPNPNRLAFSNHKMQVVCYDMMLESTYGEHRKGFNAVFYFKCPESPYRNLVSEHIEKRQVLQERNEIVAYIYQLAARDFSVPERIKNNGVRGLPIFKESVLAQFQLFYQPGRIVTAYYQEMRSFLIREFINTKSGPAAERRGGGSTKWFRRALAGHQAAEGGGFQGDV